ncbi:hypothetical protein K402DRAFT_396276 [Aulographum hederae CBS 113979]|uniref:Arb2 domain-containing protein n=1 Tax=Aulographum hederae CBS 113979 TaxID=1176131 RepID=A0A6G1GS76_9PEZI|nr:hypothetical protein K402DRAFT_396276 [Aulographum hederae CBS 113979]
MYVRQKKSLPKDPIFPTDLGLLGYSIDDSREIRTIDPPHSRFQFYKFTNARWNERQRQAMHTGVTREIIQSMAKIGIKKLAVPQLKPSDEIPSTEPHVDIFATPQEQLKLKKSVVVVVGSPFQNLGVWSWKGVFNDNIDDASSISLAKGLAQRPMWTNSTVGKVGLNTKPNGLTSRVPGLIILNQGERWYSYKEGKAMTQMEWYGRKKESPLHRYVDFNDQLNTVSGSRDAEEHIRFVLDNIVKSPDFVHPDARVYVIGIEYGATALVDVLDKSWNDYKSRVSALALSSPFIRDPDLTSSFRDFLRHRSRAWRVEDRVNKGCVIGAPSSISNSAVVAPVQQSQDDDWGYKEDTPTDNTVEPVPTFSAGPDVDTPEHVMSGVWKDMLAFFEEVDEALENGGEYGNPEFVVEPLPTMEEPADAEVIDLARIREGAGANVEEEDILRVDDLTLQENSVPGPTFTIPMHRQDDSVSEMHGDESAEEEWKDLGDAEDKDSDDGERNVINIAGADVPLGMLERAGLGQ